MGVDVVVVMTISERQADHMVDTLDFPYPVYCDERWDLFTAFETGFASGPPMPAWVVVDGGGTIRYLWRARDHIGAPYPEADAIIAMLPDLLAR